MAKKSHCSSTAFRMPPPPPPQYHHQPGDNSQCVPVRFDIVIRMELVKEMKLKMDKY